MRHLKIILLASVFLLILQGTGNCSIFSNLFNWGGPSLLATIQAKVNGKVTAKEISGNPFTGLVYKDFAITAPDGKTIFAADRLEVRLSLASVPAFHLDVGTLALFRPRIYLIRKKSGQWNYSELIKKEAKPSKPPGLMGKITDYFLREVTLSDFTVKNGELFITAAGATTHYSDLELKSRVTVAHWGQPDEKASLNLAELALTTPQGRAQLETSLTYSSGLAKIESLNLKLAGRTVLTLKGEVCRPLTELTCTLTGKLGPLTGDQIHGFWSRWPAPWNLAANFDFSSTPHGGKIRLQGKVGQADLQAKGYFDAKAQPPVFELTADLEGLSPAQLEALPGIKPQQVRSLSPVSAHLRLKGKGRPWSPAYVDGHLEVKRFRYRDLQVNKVNLDLSGTAASQSLQGYVEGNFGALSLDSRGHLLPFGQDKSLHGVLTLKTKNFKPAVLGMAKLPGTTLNTAFTGKFRLPPSLSMTRLYLAGDLTAHGRVKNEPLRALQAAFILENRKLAISSAAVRALGVAANLKGTLTESGLDITFVASTSGARALPLPSGSSLGFLHTQGSVRGPWRSPQIKIVGSARNVSVRGTRLKSASLVANLAGLPPQAGHVELSGVQLQTHAGDFSRFHLQARGTGGHWQFQAEATSPKYPRFKLAGTADLSSRPLDIYIRQVSWQGRTLKIKNQAPFQVRVFPGYEISPANFQVDGGTVVIQLLARGRELSGGVQVKNVDATLLAPADFPATGKINGAVSLTGTPAAPIITAQVALIHGKLRDIPIQSLSTTLNYQTGQAEVAGNLQPGPRNSRLIWQGTVPVAFSLSPLKFAMANRGLDLKLQSQNINLSLLRIVTSQVQSANSKVDILAQAKGNPHQPTVTGYIRWSAGTIILKKAGTPYRLEAGEIRLQNHRITIPGIVLVSNGTARFSGEFSLTGGGRSQAQARLDNFLVLNRGGNDLWSNGVVDLNGPNSSLVVKGGFNIPKADFRPTFFESEQNPDIILVPRPPKSKKSPVPVIYKNMTVAVTIDAPKNIWLKDPMGKAELTAHLKADKSPGDKLLLAGKIRTLHGSMQVEGNKFKVERAIITLPGVPHKPILVDAKATHQVENADILIVVLVNGTITNPQVHMESQPPLPPTDVLSYLVFGAPAATLTRDQYLTFAAQYGILGGAGGNKLGEILGSTIPFLSGIKVKTGMVSGRPTVGLEKNVTKNVSVFVSRNLNEERGVYEQQVGVQYKINRHWGVESQVGTRNSGADVFYSHDF
jgi:autotransporter translocation and assembly factor TamB